MQKSEHQIAPSPAAAVQPPTSSHRQRCDCPPLDSVTLRETSIIAEQKHKPGRFQQEHAQALTALLLLLPLHAATMTTSRSARL